MQKLEHMVRNRRPHFWNTQKPHGYCIQHSELPHMCSVLKEILTALFNIVYVNLMYVTE